MFSFTNAENDIFKRADLVADFNCGPKVPSLIEPSVIFNLYYVYPFTFSGRVKLTFLSPVSHSSFWKNVK